MKKLASMTVDTHVHVVAKDEQRYPIQPTGTTPIWFREMPITVGQLLQLMDESGVDRAALVQGIRLFTTREPETTWLDDPSTYPV